MNGRRFEDETFEGFVRQDCTLEGYAFYDCVFSRCTLENVRLVRCTFSGCTFSGCRVSGLETLHSTVSLAALENCALVGVDWSRLPPAGMFAEPIASMRTCRLKYNSFYNMTFRGFDFAGTDLIGCNFGESEVSGCDFRDCRLDRTEFFHCDLRRSDFRGAAGYQIDVTANKIKDAAFSLPEAIRLLNGLGIVLEG